MLANLPLRSFLYGKNDQIRMINQLHKNPLFVFGLSIRIILILFHTRSIQNEWFIPFMRNTILNFSFDPWSNFLDNGGTHLAFPYGLSMLLAYLPLSYIGNLTDTLFDFDLFTSYGFNLTALIFDYLTLILLALIIQKFSTTLLLLTYWCSPFLIYITYFYGQLDIVPISILFCSICMLSWNRWRISALLISLSISCKFSMLIALPLILIYIYKRRGFQSELIDYLSITSIFTLLLNLHFFISPGFKLMVSGTREIQKLYALKVAYGEDLNLYVIPIIYLLSLYLVWRLYRLTTDLFIISTGISFFSLLIFIPPAPAWYLWSIPFLVFYQIKSTRDIFLLGLLFNITCVFNSYLSINNNFSALNINDFSFFTDIKINSLENTLRNIVFTIQQSLSVLLSIRMFVYGLQRNSFYQITNEPFIFSLSCYDKDISLKLAQSCSKLFEGNSFKINTTRRYCSQLDQSFLSNPYIGMKEILNINNKSLILQNNFSELTQVKDLIDDDSKKNIINRILERKPEYLLLLMDKLNIPLALKDKIKLRIIFSNSEACEDILSDFEYEKSSLLLFYFNNYISQNDLSHDQEKALQKDHLQRLIVFLPIGFLHDQLLRLSIAICPIRVDTELTSNRKYVKLIFDGEPCKEDIAEMARSIIPQIDDFALKDDCWRAGYFGILQIIILSYISKGLQVNN
tara:strand:- start:1715 stop:3772 length:2058 start_codon:yes stop_codon:yes gene_type:complete